MRLLFYLGFMLLILAFAAGAADVIPRNFARGGGSGFVSTFDFSASGYKQICIEANNIHPNTTSSE